MDGRNDGFDTLVVLDDGQVFLKLEFARNLEAIDLRNGFDNEFSVDAQTLVSNGISTPLYITGDAGDAVSIGDPNRWTDTGQTISMSSVSTHDFHLYQAVYQTTGGDIMVQLAIDDTLTQPSLV